MFAEHKPTIRGIVLAGMHRWDENSLEMAMPRALLPVAQSPLILYALRWLCDGGIREATICANSVSRYVRNCLSDGSQLGMDLDYYEDWTPRGPAGCARDAGTRSGVDTLVIVDGTIIPRMSLARLLEAHYKSAAAVTVVTDPHPSERNGADGQLSPAGIYVFQREVLDRIRPTGYQDIKEILIPDLHLAGQRVMGYMAEDVSPRVLDGATYLAINEWMLEQISQNGSLLPEYRKEGESRIHRTAQVAAETKLIGPSLIGPGTLVEPGATIVGPTAIGSECTIRRGALVCRSVLWDQCAVGSDSILDGCILTNQAVVKDGAKLHNVIHMPARRQNGSFLRRLLAGQKRAEDVTNSAAGAIKNKQQNTRTRVVTESRNLA